MDTFEQFDGLFDSYGNWKKGALRTTWEAEDNVLDDPAFHQVLTQCISNLPDRWMTAVQLKYLKEKKAPEICQELGISTTNYWQLLHRAKLKLRGCLNEHWFKKA